MVEIKKSSESYNPLFKRKELMFSIDNFSMTTPKLYEVRQALSKQQGVSEDTVYIIRLDTQTGTNRTYGKAEIYDSFDLAVKTVPKHIQIRNAPSRREDQGEKK